MLIVKIKYALIRVSSFILTLKKGHMYKNVILIKKVNFTNIFTN